MKENPVCKCDVCEGLKSNPPKDTKCKCEDCGRFEWCVNKNTCDLIIK